MIAHVIRLFAICQTTTLSCYECVYNTFLASHIDTTTLADGTYELVPEVEEGPGEAQVNFAGAVERPNPTPEALETNSVQEGKPRSMSLYFKVMQLIIVSIYLRI